MSQNSTVFIVDDDSAVRDSLSALVRSAGLAVETSPSAEAFLEKYDPSRPGCLIADIRMLELSGLDLQQRMAKEKNGLPVIIISAFANAPLAVRAMQQGAVDLLEKPFEATRLMGAIEKAIALDDARRKSLVEWEALVARRNALSTDERTVMDMIVAGKANKIIARELNIGLRTVEARRHNVFEKMVADSLADLVRMQIAIDRGPS